MPADAAPRTTHWTEFRGRGFWCRDGLLQLWLAMLVDELDSERGQQPKWLLDLRNDWHCQATSAFDGLMTAQLDQHVACIERRRHVIALCGRVRAQLACGHYQPGRIARLIGAARWQQATIGPRLLTVADALAYLLNEAQKDAPLAGSTQG